MCLITFRDLCCKICHTSIKTLPEKTTYCHKAKRGVSAEGSPGVYKSPCHLIEHATESHYEGFCSGRGFCLRPEVLFNGVLDMVANRSQGHGHDQQDIQNQEGRYPQGDRVMQSPSNMACQDLDHVYQLSDTQWLPLPQPLQLRGQTVEILFGPENLPALHLTTYDRYTNQPSFWKQHPVPPQRHQQTPAQQYQPGGHQVTQQRTRQTASQGAEPECHYGDSQEYNQAGVFQQGHARQLVQLPAGPSGFYGVDGVWHFW